MREASHLDWGLFILNSLKFLDEAAVKWPRFLMDSVIGGKTSTCVRPSSASQEPEVGFRTRRKSPRNSGGFGRLEPATSR